MKKLSALIILFLNFNIVDAQNTLNNKDEKFVKEAAQGSLLEVKLGHLAISNGSSQEVKDFGQNMITDHSNANKELGDLSARKSWKMPMELSAEGQKKYNELSKKKGKEFDQAYSDCMEKDHKKDLQEFKEEAANSTDSDLKSWSGKYVPILQHHLDMAMELNRKTAKK
jgi:putative membrane protein